MHLRRAPANRDWLRGAVRIHPELPGKAPRHGGPHRALPSAAIWFAGRSSGTRQHGRRVMRSRPWSGGVSSSSRSPLWHSGSPLEPLVAVGGISLAVLTLNVPASIETRAGWDPDRASGRAEWLVAVAPTLCAGTVAIGALRPQWAAARG